MKTLGFLIALAIILLILFFRIGVKVRAGGDLSLVLDCLLFRIPLYPKKEKDIRLSDYKIKNYRHLKAKREKKQLKKQLRQQKKRSKNAHDDTADKVEQARLRAHGIKTGKQDIKALVDTVTSVAKIFLSRFGRHLQIKVKRLVVVVGSGDAATTAVVYGGVCGAVQGFVELLDNCLHVKYSRNAEIKVIPDFTSEKSGADIDIVLSLRVWQALDILLRSGITYLKSKQ